MNWISLAIKVHLWVGILLHAFGYFSYSLSYVGYFRLLKSHESEKPTP
jgi:hypothetical protein